VFRTPVRRERAWGYGERVMVTPLFAYYEGIDTLSDHLASVGAHNWAEALRNANKVDLHQAKSYPTLESFFVT
jgi:hypothetical protein